MKRARRRRQLCSPQTVNVANVVNAHLLAFPCRKCCLAVKQPPKLQPSQVFALTCASVQSSCHDTVLNHCTAQQLAMLLLPGIIRRAAGGARWKATPAVLGKQFTAAPDVHHMPVCPRCDTSSMNCRLAAGQGAAAVTGSLTLTLPAVGHDIS
jgi:hypothetical protein